MKLEDNLKIAQSKIKDLQKAAWELDREQLKFKKAKDDPIAAKGKFDHKRNKSMN